MPVDNTPAFPIPLQPGQSWQVMAPCDGMTLRQYAAIKLRVPNSGTDWLDAMIVEAKRDELAAMAMQSVLDGSWPDLDLKPKQHLSPIENSAVFAYEIADAMLKAREST